MRSVSLVLLTVPTSVMLLLGCGSTEALDPSLPVEGDLPPAQASQPQLLEPSSLNAVAFSQTQIDLSWQDNSSKETGFEVYRSTTGISGTFSLLTTTVANTVAYRDRDLVPGKGYCYRVRAVRVYGKSTTYSTFSNYACAATPPYAPAAVSGTKATPLGNTVQVTWTDNSTNEDGFRVYRSTDGGAVWNLEGTRPANDAWWGASATPEQHVCFRVIAFNAGGDAPPSDMACTTPPAAPTNLTARAVDASTLELTWKDNSAVEDGYQVWLHQASTWCCGGGAACDTGYTYEDGYFYEDGGLVADLPPNTTTYRAAPLNADGCYEYSYYYVVATKDGGRSDAAVEGGADPVTTLRALWRAP